VIAHGARDRARERRGSSVVTFALPHRRQETFFRLLPCCMYGLKISANQLRIWSAARSV
jgi:hypothetical protein